MYMDMTFLRTVSASSESMIVLPIDLLILGVPSVPGSTGKRPTEVLRLGEHVAVELVEAARDLAGELDVRHLVLADRHDFAADHQDVGGLQHRVVQQAERGALELAGRASAP